MNFAKVESEDQLAKKAEFAAALEQRAAGTAALAEDLIKDDEDGESKEELNDEI